MKTLIVNQSQAGQRLDHVIAQIFPEHSLRLRRKLWDNWHIFVDNKPQGAGYAVKAGQIVSLKPKDVLAPTSQNETPPAAYTIENNNNFTFLYKPQALHSTHLESGGPSLEAQLPFIEGAEEVSLCNRLDAGTSGIVVAAKHDAARQIWQELEAAGKCQKRYVALVQGDLQEGQSYTIKAALDTDKRKKSRILSKDAAPLRHTFFQVLAKVDDSIYASLCQYFPNFPKDIPTDLYFMACTIYKGARHQIRAHAAHAGFALYHDHRYTKQNCTPKNECFCLHHGALVLPDAHIYCPAPWQDALPAHTQATIKAWLLQSP